MTTSSATRRNTCTRWKTGGRSTSKGTGNAIALRGELVKNLDVGVQSLEERELPECHAHRLHRLGQCRRRLAVEDHRVARDEVAHELHLGLRDQVLMLEQGIGVHI